MSSRKITQSPKSNSNSPTTRTKIDKDEMVDSENNFVLPVDKTKVSSKKTVETECMSKVLEYKANRIYKKSSNIIKSNANLSNVCRKLHFSPSPRCHRQNRLSDSIRNECCESFQDGTQNNGNAIIVRPNIRRRVGGPYRQLFSSPSAAKSNGIMRNILNNVGNDDLISRKRSHEVTLNGRDSSQSRNLKNVYNITNSKIKLPSKCRRPPTSNILNPNERRRRMLEDVRFDSILQSQMENDINSSHRNLERHINDGIRDLVLPERVPEDSDLIHDDTEHSDNDTELSNDDTEISDNDSELPMNIKQPPCEINQATDDEE